MLIKSPKDLLEAAEHEAFRIVEAAKAKAKLIEEESQENLTIQTKETVSKLEMRLRCRLSDLEDDLVEIVRGLVNRVLLAELRLSPETIAKHLANSLRSLDLKLAEDCDLVSGPLPESGGYSVESVTGEKAKLYIDPLGTLNNLIDEALSLP